MTSTGPRDRKHQRTLTLRPADVSSPEPRGRSSRAAPRVDEGGRSGRRRLERIGSSRTHPNEANGSCAPKAHARARPITRLPRAGRTPSAQPALIRKSMAHVALTYGNRVRRRTRVPAIAKGGGGRRACGRDVRGGRAKPGVARRTAKLLQHRPTRTIDVLNRGDFVSRPTGAKLRPAHDVREPGIRIDASRALCPGRRSRVVEAGHPLDLAHAQRAAPPARSSRRPDMHPDARRTVGESACSERGPGPRADCVAGFNPVRGASVDFVCAKRSRERVHDPPGSRAAAPREVLVDALLGTRAALSRGRLSCQR